MRRLAIASLVLVASLAPDRVRAGEEAKADPLAGLSGAKALEFAKVLAGDAMKGRRTGTDDGRRVEEWISGEIANFPLTPVDPEGIYYQEFEFPSMFVAKPIGLAVGASAFEYGTDFIDLFDTGAGKVEAEVVYVGYGISAPDRGVDDYAGVDVKGKIVLALRGAPGGRDAEFPVERFIGAKSSLAADRGAVGFLVCDGGVATKGTIQQRFFRPNLPAVWVSGAAADRIVRLAPANGAGKDAAGKDVPGTSILQLKRAADAGEPSKSFATGVKATLEVNGKFVAKAVGRNVIGGFLGTDPDLRGETIVIGAHADHLGVDATGRIFNGADDNASGSAALMMLAKTLAENGWRPKRTVVFAWFAAEEQGLAGSKALARGYQDVFPADKHVVLMLNLDMAGQGKPAVKFGGGVGYPALWKKAVSYVAPADLAVPANFAVEENSDHWAFHDRGVPAFFAVTDGDHPNYHQPADDVGNLKPECLEAAARVLGRMLVGFADEPAPLSTGREVPSYVLREGARVVEGAGPATALAATLARPAAAPAERTAFVDAGWAAVALPIDEQAPADGLTWAKLDEAARRRAAEVVLVRSASDLVGAPRGSRTAILPRYVCPDAARRAPADLAKLRELGVRWIEPFAAAKPLTDAERDAILAAAAAARLVVDLTGLPAASLGAARAKLGKAPATYRVSAPLAADANAAAEALVTLRRTLGPDTLLLVSGGAEDPLLTLEALSAAPDPSSAPVAVVSADTARLEEALVPSENQVFGPTNPQRLRVRALFGGSFADFLNRVR